MKLKVFFDTNVLLDVILGDRPSSPASIILFEAVKNGSLEGVMTTQSLLDAAYIIVRMGKESEETLRQRMMMLIRYFNIDSLNSFNIKEACLSPFGDFEDEAQLALALDRYCHYIVTGDKQFRASHAGDYRIQFKTPEELVGMMQAE